jgi:DNA-binding response OmpR family regulator
MLRRPRTFDATTAPERPATVRLGALTLNHERRSAELGGVELVLTKVEFDLLGVLVARPEMVVTRADLLERVWGTEWGDTHLVDVHVANLRRKLSEVAHGDVVIVTVRGVGFRLDQKNGPV